MHVQYRDVSQLLREYTTILLMCTLPKKAVRNIRSFWQQKGPGIFQSVYQSDEEETEDSKGTKLSGKGKVVKSNDYPSIFKKESDDTNEDEEDWYINYEQQSQFCGK